MYYKKAKQLEIENLAKRVIFDDVEIERIADRENYTNSILEELSSIFEEDTGFRPHYFFVHALLENEKLQSLVEAVNIIQAIKSFLTEINTDDITSADYKGLYRYTLDESFCYNVDMFVEALIYECTFRKNVLKNETGIQQAVQKLNLLGNNPKDVFEKEFSRFSKALETYKDSFESKLDEAKELNEKTKDISKDARKTSEDARVTSEEAQKISEDAKELSEKAKTLSEKAKSTSDEVKENSNNLLTNVLTILGIFVAIIFAIVAAYFTMAMEKQSSTFSSITQVNLGRFILMGQVLFDLLFLFLHMISKLSQKSIAVSCSGCEKSICQKGKCTFPQRVMRKYAYVIIANFIAVCMYIILAAWWFIEEFVYKVHFDKIHEFTGSHPLLFVFFVIFVALLLTITPIVFVIKYSKSHKIP